MADTLSDYQAREEWDELDPESKINVLSTYIIDLEVKVERLERKTEQLDEDISIVDGGY